ncbi:DnaJ domain-containing protein [Candidatus Kapabacteria bacterium]|nr:DnaJ domain-containing protein [Candidatus Kapabacteria bacterium]
MKFKNYYKILGVKRTASTADIKSRYKELVKIFHPDKHNGHPSIVRKFQEIKEAYDVLGNLDNRLEYSQYLHSQTMVKSIVEMKDYEYRKERNIKPS